MTETNFSPNENEEQNPAPQETGTEDSSANQNEAQEEQVEVVTATVASKEEAEGNGAAHDDFDWDTGNKRSMRHYENLEETQKQYESTLNEVNENEIVKGTIVGKTSSEVVLNIGFKSDGLVPLSEFRDVDEVRVGDEVEVYVVKKEDEKGQLILSRKNAKLMRAWEQIVDAYENDKIVKGTVTSKTKGGLITDVFGLETFLPGSQIDVKPIIDYDQYVGKVMEFKVVKINEAIKNAVVSHKALIESDLETQRAEIMGKLEKGQVLEGVIKNITDFGAFIDLGGVDGLLYITDISWGRINHPNEVLALNQKLHVVVLDFDDEKKRISLGLKQLQPHPWDQLSADLEVGSKVKGKIVNIEDYGAFLEIHPGVEGLIHISEVSWSNQPVNSRDFFQLGQELESVVMTLDREDRKMSLSLKQLTKDPWTEIAKEFPIGSRHSGEVKNITPYGVFVELREGVGGMIHISDLSWTKRYNHPSEFTKVGEHLDVIVLEIDNENRKMSLGHKQIEEDPWDTFEEVFPVGSVHQATIIKKDDKGAVMMMPYGVEAFAPLKHLKKENGNTVESEESVEVKVLEFDRKDKKIIVSHSRIHEDSARDVKREDNRKKGQEDEETRAVVKKTQKGVEKSKSTFGDLDVLSKLKQQMDEGETPAKGAKAKKETATPEAESPETLAEGKAETKAKGKSKAEADAPEAEESTETEAKAEEETPKAESKAKVKAKDDASESEEADAAEDEEGKTKKSKSASKAKSETPDSEEDKA